ncbi:DUF6103 family protein [Chakrabartyella piscis]|uniref:DUF6103 family protein n=1 Tax=Chakrabartyella piscis TaxID=2918914 RepID=UPI002958DBE4|nr:DUF6103 family protein [Chakrabartyella piscis]
MKKTKIVLEFEKDKLDALVFYLQKKEEKLEKELETVIEELYQKRVPAVTREYLESRIVSESKPKSEKIKEQHSVQINTSATRNETIESMP